MIKKALLILILPYLALMLIESCNYPDYCVRKETRNITDIFFKHYFDPQPFNPDLIILKMKYESYFVSNFQVNILNKSYARSEPEYNPNGCFEGFSNAIKQIKIKSLNDFDSGYLAGSELNPLFKDDLYNDTIKNDNFDWSNLYLPIPNSFTLYNFKKPTIDSIHTLFFEVNLEDGQTFYDTLINVNLNRTFRRAR